MLILTILAYCLDISYLPVYVINNLVLTPGSYILAQVAMAF
jgi:hypothetical protein